MPLRPLNRKRSWLLVPTLDELLTDADAARFLVAFIDGQARAQ